MKPAILPNISCFRANPRHPRLHSRVFPLRKIFQTNPISRTAFPQRLAAEEITVNGRPRRTPKTKPIDPKVILGTGLGASIKVDFCKKQ